MKLLVVSHACARAVNQQLYETIQRQTGWDITLVIPQLWRDEFGNDLDEHARSSFKGRILKVPVWMNGNIILHCYRFRWRRFLNKERFDAIYINHEPYAVAASQICMANNWAERPASLGFYSCQNIIKCYPPPFRWMERMVYRKSRFAFPITKTVADVLRAKGFEGDLAVAPLAVDPELYHPYPREVRPHKVIQSEGMLTLGYVGRLVAVKGLQTLAVALSHLLDLKWHMIVIGSGPFESEFYRLLEGAGVRERVTHLGFVPHHETPRYLAAIDVLVLPSETQPNWKEQFGRVIPEALACGAAVVGSDSGEIPNLIRKSGGGLVFPERNSTALADALRKLIVSRETREEMANRGRRWVISNISLETVATRMISTIRHAVGKN